MFVAFILLFAFIKIIKKNKFKVLSLNKLAIFAGLFLSINYFGYMKGIELTNASNAQVMIQMAPTLLILIGFFYFKEKPNLLQIIGIFIALAGFYLFFQNQIQNSFQNSSSYLSGNLYIVVAAIAWALFSTLQKLAGKTDLIQFNLIVYFVSSLLLLPGAELSSLPSLVPFQWLILLFLGLNTLIAYGCLGEAFKRAPASQVSLIIVLNPLLTIFLFYLMSRFNMQFVTPELISVNSLVGALLVVTGVGTALIKK